MLKREELQIRFYTWALRNPLADWLWNGRYGRSYQPTSTSSLVMDGCGGISYSDDKGWTGANENDPKFSTPQVKQGTQKGFKMANYPWFWTWSKTQLGIFVLMGVEPNHFRPAIGNPANRCSRLRLRLGRRFATTSRLKRGRRKKNSGDVWELERWVLSFQPWPHSCHICFVIGWDGDMVE